jgi:hypothetical protein
MAGPLIVCCPAIQKIEKFISSLKRRLVRPDAESHFVAFMSSDFYVEITRAAVTLSRFGQDLVYCSRTSEFFDSRMTWIASSQCRVVLCNRQ